GSGRRLPACAGMTTGGEADGGAHSAALCVLRGEDRFTKPAPAPGVRDADWAATSEFIPHLPSPSGRIAQCPMGPDQTEREGSGASRIRNCRNARAKRVRCKKLGFCAAGTIAFLSLLYRNIIAKPGLLLRSGVVLRFDAPVGQKPG